MITLLLCLCIIVIVLALALILGGVLVVAWPIVALLAVGLLIDLAFLRLLFGRKKESKK